MCSNICVVVRKNSCRRVVLRGCGKLLGSKSCEVQFSTSSQADKNLYVCVCVCQVVVLSLLVRPVMLRKVHVVVRTLDLHVMRSFRSTGVTVMRRSTAVVTRTQDVESTYSSLTTRTRCGGPRLSTTESTTPNSHH